MNWNTGVIAGGTALLALALGGVRGLLVATVLAVLCWLLQSINHAAAAHHANCAGEPDTPPPEADRKAEQERHSQQRQEQAEQESATERRRQHQSKWAPYQSEEDEWWSVLEVPPEASADEIRRAYRHKIKQCHPDRVVGLAPELLELAERYTRTLNAAYSEANRERRSESAMR